ncbi:MAG: hypothetical protein Q7K34_01915 [archaeon]|nr:hypothetical protein [archaeon]
MDSSIIEIIQKMVKEGESEETIVKTLKELGVDEKKAKKLLLIGEADTFALLRSELSKIVKENIKNEIPGLEKAIEDETQKTARSIQDDVTKKSITEIQQYEKDMRGELSLFREQAQEKIEKVSFLGDKVKEKIEELASEVRTVQLDLDEMKVKGISGRNQNISRTLIGLGILFGLADLYLFFTSYSAGTSIDSIIVMVLVAVISVTMLFVATVI